jgi:hypothetical protein
MKRPLITLLTDFGSADHYVAAMKGVMVGICPNAQFVDITHEAAVFAIADAAWTLAQAAPCFPRGTVHLAVVDPGVGGARRPILAESNGQWFVAPDNGVLTLALEPDPHHKVHEINAERFFRHPVSRTFHGRDIFAPVAAHLAAGTPATEFGPCIEDWVQLETAHPRLNPDGSMDGTVLRIDRFGNLITNFDAALPRPWRLEVGSRFISLVVASYSDAPRGALFAIAGSAGTIEISMNQASAARELGAIAGTPVRLVGSA